jgi:transcriptional regulator with XRE-family HTH domain
MAAIATYIKSYREGIGLSQRGLALKANVDNSTIARIEKGGKPSPEVLIKIATALGVSKEYLISLSYLEDSNRKEKPASEGEPIIKDSIAELISEVQDVTEQEAKVIHQQILLVKSLRTPE